MNDKELSEIINMSAKTMSDWKKKDADNYSKIIYELLKSIPKEELQKKVDAIKLLKELQ